LPLPDRPSIAVLPFKNMSGDPEQEYFADGIVEEITTALSRFRQLFVIARNSSFTYRGRTVDVKQSAVSWEFDMCLKGACGGRGIASASRGSLSMLQLEHISGQTVSMEHLKIFSSYKTG
jgi:hypothetical protein